MLTPYFSIVLQILPGIWIVWRTLVEDTRCSRDQWTIHDVRVSGDPPRVRRTPVDITRLKIKDELGGRGNANLISAVHVHDPLRLASRARGIEHVQRVFGVELCALARRRGELQQVVIPDVAATVPGNVVASAFDRDDLLHDWTLAYCRIHDRLQRNDLAAEDRSRRP